MRKPVMQSGGHGLPADEPDANFMEVSATLSSSDTAPHPREHQAPYLEQ